MRISRGSGRLPMEVHMLLGALQPLSHQQFLRCLGAGRWDRCRGRGVLCWTPLWSRIHQGIMRISRGSSCLPMEAHMLLGMLPACARHL